MPKLKSAFKAMRVTRKKYERNQGVINELKTLLKKFSASVDAKDTKNIKKLLPLLVRKIDKAKSKGILHKKTASRKISRITAKAARFK